MRHRDHDATLWCHDHLRMRRIKLHDGGLAHNHGHLAWGRWHHLVRHGGAKLGLHGRHDVSWWDGEIRHYGRCIGELCQRSRELFNDVRKLVVKGARGVVLERQRRIADWRCRAVFLAESLFQVAFQGILEESVVVDGEPVENLLLLLRPDAVVSVEVVEKFGFWLFQDGIGVAFEVSQV